MTNQEILDQISKMEKGLNNPSLPESAKNVFKGKIAALKAELEKTEAKVEKKEEKLQAEEKKIQSDLEEQIAKLEKGLNNPSLPASAKEAIKKKIAAAKEEVAKQKAEIKEDVKQSAKETKEIKAAVKKLAEVAKKAGRVKTTRKNAAPKVESKDGEREKKSEKRQSKLKGMMADLEQLIHKNKYLASKYEGKHVDLGRDAKRPAKPFGYRFVGKGDYRVPTAAQIKEGKKTGKIDYEGRPNRADKGPKKEYKFRDGGEVDNQNAEMVLSKAKELKHHADELENIVSRNSKVDAWEVAKMERAATDASDVTHYEDGKAGSKYEFADGGEIDEKISSLRKQKEELRQEYDNAKMDGQSDFKQSRLIAKINKINLELNDALKEKYSPKAKMADGGMMAKGGDINSLKNQFKSPNNEIQIIGNKLKIQKKDNPLNFLTITQMSSGDYNVDVTAGSIQNPSGAPNATWWNLYDKYHNYDGLVEIIKRYGIPIKNSEQGGYMAKGGEMAQVNKMSKDELKNWLSENYGYRGVDGKGITKDLKDRTIENMRKEVLSQMKYNEKNNIKYADGGMMADGGMIYLISDDGYEVNISDSDFSKETKMFFKKSMTQQEVKKLGTSKYNSFIHHLSKKGYDKMAKGGKVGMPEWAVTITSEDGESYDWDGFAKSEDDALVKAEKEADFGSVESSVVMITDANGKKIEYKKGGKLSSKAKYIPKRDIAAVEIDKNGKEVEIDGADLLDGVYVKKGKKMAHGGMTPGRYYKDNSGNELRFVGESDGKLLFKDGETVVTKTESDFEEEPREKKLFKFFAEGGTVTKMERKAKVGAKKVVKSVSGAGKVSVGEIAKLAKSIRKEGEKWTDAIKRAAAQLKK